MPAAGQNPFPLQALALGAIGAGLGAAALVYLWLEYRRVVRARGDRGGRHERGLHLPG